MAINVSVKTYNGGLLPDSVLSISTTINRPAVTNITRRVKYKHVLNACG